MGIFRSNDPTVFDDIDGIIIDESAPPPSITGVSANIACLIGQFQRGPSTLSLVLGSLGEFQEIYGKSTFSGNKQLRNKRFGALKIIRVVASDAAKASRTLDEGVGEVPEIYTVQCVADVSGSLGGTYYTFETISAAGVKTPRYAWFDVDNGSVDPAVAGRTGHEVDISADDSASTVAAALQAVIDALTDAGAAVVTDTVTVTNANNGDVEDVAAGTSGFTVNVTQQGSGADKLKFEALYEGAYGNNLSVTVEDGTASVGRKYTLKDNNTDAVLPNEVYDQVEIVGKTAAEVAEIFAGSALMAVTLVGTPTAEPIVAAEASLASGSDGTVADTDYESAIAVAEQTRAANLLWLDSYNATRNGYLKTHLAATQDKMAVLCGAESDDRAAAITDVANYRDSDGRMIYAWPYIQTVINGVLEFQNPGSWAASVFSQTAPHIALSKTSNTQYLAGIVALKFNESRAGFIALDQAGIMAFERDPDIGFIIKNAVTTQIVNSSKRTILRRRMADFLTDSIALFLKNYQNDVNSTAKRDEVKAQILDFDERLVRDGILPGQQDVKNGLPVLVDTESLNTDSVVASGMFKILYKRRIFSSMRYIVLQAEIGESVVVTEA